jgi:hypothetical protein
MSANAGAEKGAVRIANSLSSSKRGAARVTISDQARVFAAEHEIQQPTAIDVHECRRAAAAGIDSVELLRNEAKSRFAAQAIVAHKVYIAGRLAHDKIQISIAIDARLAYAWRFL